MSSEGPTTPAKRLKEVYLVSKKKFFSDATRDELEKELILDGIEDDEDTHRIIQFKVR